MTTPQPGHSSVSPNASQKRSTVQVLRPKAAEIFNTLRLLLGTPTAVTCLSWNKQKVERQGLEQKLRAAVLVCWRIIPPDARRTIKQKILWHRYMEAACADAPSRLHAIWREDQCTDDEFLEWCQRSKKVTPCTVYEFVSAITLSTGKAFFTEVWQVIPEIAQNKLLSVWWDMISCSCCVDTEYKMGRTVYTLVPHNSDVSITL